jgi:DNA (cytosine-5)-methyltransferase 1
MPRISDQDFSFLPTPTVHGNYNRKGVSKNSGDGLITVLRKGFIPTPTANDGKKVTLPKSQRGRDSIPAHLMRNGLRGRANPEYWEWMMGFPAGWTAIGADGSERSETP